MNSFLSRRSYSVDGVESYVLGRAVPDGSQGWQPSAMGGVWRVLVVRCSWNLLSPSRHGRASQGSCPLLSHLLSAIRFTATSTSMSSWPPTYPAFPTS